MDNYMKQRQREVLSLLDTLSRSKLNDYTIQDHNDNMEVVNPPTNCRKVQSSGSAKFINTFSKLIINQPYPDFTHCAHLESAYFFRPETPELFPPNQARHNRSSVKHPIVLNLKSCLKRRGSMDAPRGYSQGTTVKFQLSEREIDEYWYKAKVEPVASSWEPLIKQDLEKAWSFHRENEFRDRIQLIWSRGDDDQLTLDNDTGDVPLYRKATHLYNKATAFYWLSPSQPLDMYEDRKENSMVMYAAICEEWFRSHKTRPNIEFGHFFANPVRVTSTGPTTVREIIKAHHSICEQATHLLKQSNATAQKHRTLSGKTLPNAVFYSILPLYRAIVVILDRSAFVEDDWGDDKDSDSSDDEDEERRDIDGLSSLCEFSRRQTVLIARTGVEDELSAPISFESLMEQALPLDIVDMVTDNVDVVRVPLATAVKFIVNLEMREELAFPKAKGYIPLDPTLCPESPVKCGSEEENYVRYCPMQWAQAIMAAAKKFGYDDLDKVPAAWESIRRVQAKKIGEEFKKLEHWQIVNNWQY
jgi:hypothetical protein